MNRGIINMGSNNSNNVEVVNIYDSSVDMGSKNTNLDDANRFVAALAEQINQVNHSLHNKFFHLKQLDNGESTNVAVSITLDMDKLATEVITDARNGFRNDVLESFVNSGVGVYGNQIVSGLPHLILLLTKTKSGNMERNLRANDRLVHTIAAKAGLTVEEFLQKDVADIWRGKDDLFTTDKVLNENLDIAFKQAHGLFSDYLPSNEWERGNPHAIIVGSAQGGKTGALIATVINDFTHNYVFDDYIEQSKHHLIHAVPLLPRRCEIMDNFIKDYAKFMEIYGNVEVCVTYYDANSGKILSRKSEAIAKLKKKSEQKANYQLTKAKEVILKAQSSEDKKDVEFFNKMYEELCDTSKAEQLFEQFVNEDTDTTVDGNVRTPKDRFKMLCKLANAAALVIDFHTDEGHFGAGANSVVVQILRDGANIWYDQSSAFFTSITWTPDMFRENENIYWIFFRYPEGVAYHGITVWNGKQLHQDPELVIDPNIQSWDNWGHLPEIGLPALSDLDWEAIISSSNFRDKKHSHEFAAGDFKDDRCVPKHWHEAAYRAGIFQMPYRNQLVPYSTWKKDFTRYSSHDEYRQQVLSALAKSPFVVFENAIRNGNYQVVNEYGVPENMLATIKLPSRMSYEYHLKGFLHDQKDYFEKKTGKKARIVFFDADERGLKHKSFMSWYKNYGLPKGYMHRPNVPPMVTYEPDGGTIKADEFVIIVITGSWRMAVRIPPRAQWSIDTAGYNYKSDTDAFLQGLVPRHWGYFKGNPVCVVSPSCDLFFKIYKKEGGKFGLNPKHVKSVKENGGRDNELQHSVKFSDALEIAVKHGFADVADDLMAFSNKIEKIVPPQAGERKKTKLPDDVKDSLELRRIMENHDFLEKLAKDSGSKFHLARTDQEVERVRDGKPKKMRYAIDGEASKSKTQNTIGVQARWGWNKHGNAGNMIGGHKDKYSHLLNLAFSGDVYEGKVVVKDIVFVTDTTRDIQQQNNELLIPKPRTLAEILQSQSQSTRHAALAGHKVRPEIKLPFYQQ